MSEHAHAALVRLTQARDSVLRAIAQETGAPSDGNLAQLVLIDKAIGAAKRASDASEEGGG